MYVVPEAVSVARLFRRRNTKSKGGNGFTSASESVISACISLPVASPLEDCANGRSPKPAISFDSMVSTERVATGSFMNSASASGLGLGLGLGRTMALPRYAKARRYVRLRSWRNVSRKKKVKRRRSTPRRAASNQKAARQLNACVRTPPSSGPSEGPRSGAA